MNAIITVRGPRPEDGSPRVRPSGEVELPRYELGAKVATRLAFGQSLAAVGARSNVVALDGEVGNSTHAEEFAKAYPERYFEMFIAEQQLVAAAVGLSVRGYIPFAATFAAFLTRAYDFIRMSAISTANIRLCGSHAGVEIGADGPSQMALEDLAMMRAVHGSTVLYPSDATSAAFLVQEMADREGVVYMRTTRGAYPVLYPPDEVFPIGGAKVVRSSADDQVTLIGAGVTLHNCLAAADQLASDGIRARVIDLYSLKPIDTDTLLAAAAATGDRLVVVEDHYPAGGMGGAVLEALSDAGHPARITHLAVQGLPGSGTPQELMEAAGISVGPHHRSRPADRRHLTTDRSGERCHCRSSRPARSHSTRSPSGLPRPRLGARPTGRCCRSTSACRRTCPGKEDGLYRGLQGSRARSPPGRQAQR